MLTREDRPVGLPLYTDIIDRLDGRIPGETMCDLIAQADWQSARVDFRSGPGDHRPSRLEFVGHLDTTSLVRFQVDYYEDSSMLHRHTGNKYILSVELSGDRIFGNRNKLVHSFRFGSGAHHVNYTLGIKRNEWVIPIVGGEKPYTISRSVKTEGWSSYILKKSHGKRPNVAHWKHSQVFRAMMILVASVNMREIAPAIAKPLATQAAVTQLLDERWEHQRKWRLPS